MEAGFCYCAGMAGSTEHRRAPRRQVVEIRKTGSWGNVVYQHVLECGHIEKRPRATSAPKLACVWCLRSESKQKEMEALSLPAPRSFINDEDTASIESAIMSAQATIASKLGVDIDAVDIATKDVNGILEIKHATVFLTARDVRNIAGLT